MSQADLNARLRAHFAASALESPQLVFWYDPEGQYQGELEGLQLNDVTILTWDDRNGFALKCQLNASRSGKFLIYTHNCHPRQRTEHSFDLLLDLELSYCSFQADLYSAWLEELGLEPSEPLRQLLKTHRRFFKEDRNRQSLALYLRDEGLRKRISRDEKWLAYAALAVRCQVQKLQSRPLEIALNVLRQGALAENNKLWKELQLDGWQTAFWNLMDERYCYCEEEPSLHKFALHILHQAGLRQAPSLRTSLPRLDARHADYCVEFSVAWQNSHADGFRQFLLATLEQDQEPWSWEELPDDELLESTVWPTADAEILRRYYQEISDNAIQPQLWENALKKRDSVFWFNTYRPFYEVLARAADLYRFRLQHERGFHETKASKLWNLYCQEYSFFDTQYRRFQQSWEQAQTGADVPLGRTLSDLATDVKVQVNNLCNNWFLSELSENWTQVALPELRAAGTVAGIDSQRAFFSQWGARNPGEKSVVIISDGLRYEVAKELSEKLSQLDPFVNCKLESCCAVFPSITKMGMAALLPHRRLSLAKGKDGHLEVLADGMSTASTNREAVLQARNQTALVLKYDEVRNSKSEALRERLRGRELVYIYHDTIDKLGHDNQVSGVCAKAVSELCTLIKRLVSANVRNVVVTADHGFLYTEMPLTEADKLGCDCREHALESGSRYLVLPAEAEPSQMAEIRLLEGNTPYRAWATKELARLKIKGQGGNYVHGGISLQELVVPVLSYSRVRSDSKAYANNPEGFDKHPAKVRLSSDIRPIVNRIFTLMFYQEEAVGNAVQPQEYIAWMTDAQGNRICDPRKFMADRSSKDASLRVHEVRFCLYGRNFSDATERYSLWLAFAEEEAKVNQGKFIPSAVKCADFVICLAFSDLDDF